MQPKSALERLISVNEVIFTTKSLADLLGVSQWCIIKRIERGKLPAHKDGQGYVILKSEYIEHLKSKK